MPLNFSNIVGASPAWSSLRGGGCGGSFQEVLSLRSGSQLFGLRILLQS